MVVDYRTKEEEKKAFVFGIVAIIVVTLLCYLAGCLISQTDFFYTHAEINLNLRKYGVRYFIQALSGIVSVAGYVLAFKKVASANSKEVMFAETNSGQPFVYDGWTGKAIITGVLTIVVALIIYLFAFKGILALIPRLMLWVWLGQAICSSAVFFIPACRPLKRIS